MLIRFVLPALLLCAMPMLHAQSAADLQTLSDLKAASKGMQLESEGATPFRLHATFSTTDFLGRPDNQGQWTEEFGTPGHRRRTVKDSNSPENYAPEDQAKIGPAPPTASGTYMQRFLVDALLLPGPSEELLGRSKITYKLQKFGTVSLRCVILDPQQPIKNRYQQQIEKRAYCLEANRPIIRLSQVAFGFTVTYNSIAHFGDRTFAQQVTASQRGHERGKLQVVKLVSAPELLQADLPTVEDVPEMATHNGMTKVGSEVITGTQVKKVAPVYPIDSKQRRISGTVILHAIIGTDGKITSLEVVSAPADDLAEAAVEAVSQWTYKPYLLNGKPTEVDTTVTVNFVIG